MSSGFIELAARGQQDVLLTGSPQITYFSGTYKRHTPFVLEAFDNQFNGTNIQWGQTAICEIPSRGDLLRALTLRLSLPGLCDLGTYYAWRTPPSPLNAPVVWLGLANGTTIGPLIAPYSSVFYYSTDPGNLALWGAPFAPYLSFNSAVNKFIFTGVSNVIVPQNSNTISAVGPLFWGFDPNNYDSSTTSNLVYNAVSGTVTPDFSIPLTGWLQRTVLNNNYPSTLGLYLSLSGALLSIGPSLRQLALSTWSINNSQNQFIVLNGNSIIFNTDGLYEVRVGFALASGSVQTFSYGINSSTIIGTYSPSVSTDPTASIVLPIKGVAGNSLSFFISGSSGSMLTDAFFVITPVDIYYAFNRTVAANSGTIPLYGNVANFTSPDIILNSDSSFTFTSPGQYMITGSLYLSPGVYATSVSLVAHGTEYIFDMSSIGQSPTFCFSIPLYVLDTSTTCSLILAKTGSGNILPGSFFSIKNITQGITFSGGGGITAPLNLVTQFYSSSSPLITVNGNGSMSFVEAGSYMFVGSFNSNNLITSVIIENQPKTIVFRQDVNLQLSNTYTISFPFYIADTTIQYYISLLGGLTSLSGLSDMMIYPIGVFAPPTPFTSYSYNDSVGTLAIKSVDLRIGGQTIQTLTGEYIEIWNELNVPLENQPGLQVLIGKYDTSSISVPGRTYYVNLPFYFFDRPELYLPLVALDRQNVEVAVTFGNFSDLTSVQTLDTTFGASVIAEYVYLADPEVNWFKNHRLDYVITQCQYDSFIVDSNNFELKFKGPVKELFLILQNSGQTGYDYSNSGLQSIGLTFNGQDAVLASTVDSVYMGTIEPFNKYLNFFSKPPGSTTFGRQFFIYSFGPGQVNFSRIRNVVLDVNVSPPRSSQQLRIVALSYNVLRVENGMGGIMFN